MDEDLVPNVASLEYCWARPWVPNSDLNSMVTPNLSSSSQPVSSLNCNKGVDFGKEVLIESKNLQEGNVSRSEGGTTNAVSCIKPLKQKKKTFLGRNVLLIDQNLCQNLTATRSFQFLHWQSLSVIKVQTQEIPPTEEQVDMFDIHNPKEQPNALYPSVSESLSQHVEDIPMSEQAVDVHEELLLEQVSERAVKCRVGRSKQI